MALESAPSKVQKASLGSMPVDVKIAIAESVASLVQDPEPRMSIVAAPGEPDPRLPVDFWDDEGLEFDRDDWHISAIASLGCVNREFAGICAPLIWRSLPTHVKYINNAAIERFRDEIVRRYGALFKEIVWRGAKSQLVYDTNEGPRFFNFGGEYDEPERARVLVTILELCPNLVDLDLGVSILQGPYAPGGRKFEGDVCSPQLLSYVSSAAGSNLRRLAIRGDGDEIFGRWTRRRFPPAIHMPEPIAVTWLINKPHLESITLTSVGRLTRETSGRRLGPFLASLPTLRRLELLDVKCIDSSWADLNWKGVLTHLKLEARPRYYVRRLPDFFLRFANSLRSLSLGGLKCFESFDEQTTPVFVLPLLERLGLFGVRDGLEPWLYSFRGCSQVTDLSIYQLYGFQMDQLQESPLNQTFPGLERLFVHRTKRSTLNRLDLLRKTCEATGVAFSTNENPWARYWDDSYLKSDTESDINSNISEQG